jgi:hypothetical protein
MLSGTEMSFIREQLDLIAASFHRAQFHFVERYLKIGNSGLGDIIPPWPPRAQLTESRPSRQVWKSSSRRLVLLLESLNILLGSEVKIGLDRFFLRNLPLAFGLQSSERPRL